MTARTARPELLDSAPYGTGRGTRGSARPLTMRPGSSTASGWTPAIVCVLAYLFVIHSGKLDIGTYAIILGLVFVLLEGKPIKVPSFLVAFGLFLAWTLATSPLALDPARAFDKWSGYGKFWLICFLMYNAVRTPAQWRIVTVGWLALFALFPFRGIVFNVLTGNLTQGRYSWNFGFRNPNDYATIALLALTLAIVHLRPGGPRWVRWGALAGAIGLPGAILLTGSRAGVLGMAMMAAILLTFSKHRMGLLTVSVCAVLIAFPLLPESTRERFGGMRFLTSSETLAQADRYGSTAERSVILSVAAAVARDHPLFGVGIGNYPIANFRYAASRADWRIASGFRDSHNTYLTLAAETGVVGLLLFGSSVVLVGIGLFHERQAEAFASGRGIGGVQGFAPTVLFAGIAGYSTMCLTGSYVYMAFPYLLVTLAARYRSPHRANA